MQCYSPAGCGLAGMLACGSGGEVVELLDDDEIVVAPDIMTTTLSPLTERP